MRVSPGVQLPPALRREAICTHTLSSKGARLVRSTCARAASPLRNASTRVCRFAVIKNQRNKGKNLHLCLLAFLSPSAPPHRPEGQPFALSEARHSYFMFLYCMPGKFANGLTADGSGGAAGAARVPRVLADEHPWAGFGGAAPGMHCDPRRKPGARGNHIVVAPPDYY